jgi:hypothetical protein
MFPIVRKKMSKRLTNLLLRFSNVVPFALTILVNGLAGSTTLLAAKNTAMVLIPTLRL